MADALVSALVKDLLGRLTSAAIQEYRLQQRLENDLLTLGDEYNQIQAVLEDAEEKQTREKAVELWLKRLRSESLKMENLLDDVLAEAMLRQLHKELSLGMKYRVRTFFSSNHNPLMFHHLGKLKSLRSVFIFKKEYTGSVSHIFDHVYLRVLYLEGIGSTKLTESICKLKHLRYLNLSNSWIEVLPESIIYLQNLQVLLLNGCRWLRKLPEGMGHMRNLRYLNLSNSNIEVLPESISDLQNLQVLLMNWCRELYKLPDGMRHMRNLQYLDIYGCELGWCLPVGIGKLTSLRGLASFTIRENEGAQIGELGYLNLLGPNLRLDGLENVKGLREARSANLKSKTHLLALDLIWLPIFDAGTIRGHDKEVLEGLEPNSRLKVMRIFYYCGKNISPSWMVNLWSLVQIQFHDCGHCEHIPPLGKLPSLRVIRLKFMSSLKCFHDDDMSGDNILFPQLQELKISYCDELINLPSNLPKLKKLTLKECEKLVSLPEEIQSFKDLNTLKTIGCKNLSRRYAKDIGVDWPKISHIQNIKFRP